MTFEEAMVELVRATDGDGNPAHLYHGDWTSRSFREAARAFFESQVVNGWDSSPSWESGLWENLAKLATATAAAIREGR